MRGSGGVLVVASVILAVSGLWRLVRARRVAKATAWLATLIAWPVLAWLVFRVEADHLRLWLGYPVAATVPWWLMSGFFIDEASRLDAPDRRSGNLATVSRMPGWALITVGLVCWGYGATHPGMSKALEVSLVAVFLYSCLIGGAWVASADRSEESV